MNSKMIIPILLGMVMAHIAVRWVYFKILKIAFDKNLVDNPNARKLQKQPVPVVGGLAVFLGLLSGILAAASYHYTFDPETESTGLLPIICAMSVMIYTGALDDILGLTPKARIAIEVAAIIALIYSSGMCIDTFSGLWGIELISWWVAVPLTVFAGVGIINAINMVDGVNGLSSGLCITCCCIFGIAFFIIGDVANAVLAFTMVASLSPFFLRNVFGLKSRMFIGDAGTMVMGILMTWFVMCMLSSNNSINLFCKTHNLNIIALSIAILSVPIFDTLRVMTMRIAKGVSPFRPDKTHLHHVFVNVGISHFITAVSEILIGLTTTIICCISIRVGASLEVQLYVAVLSSMWFVWGTYAILRYHAKRHTYFLHWLTHFSEKTHLGRTKWWKSFTKWLDGPIDYATSSADNSAAKSAVAREKFNSHMQSIDVNISKENDRKLILDYMKCKAEVHICDLIAYSGVDQLRVYAVIYEEIQSGYVKVILSDRKGNPQIVAIEE